ncbi:sulfatase family protein [Gracilibacillus phocaeensis]|uniref:sulfatase family protein n=1 Tax=Gracilibacillus phocaeensis TaxID=2042304 RepID=UPI0025705556|nr:arylsulfatase [Gracilibacillus phocaeensis]
MINANKRNNSSKKQPNIIYILADDMGYGDLSCLNENAQWKTPNLDRIAAEGISYTDAHATSAVCTPSRYSILTGRYNWRSSLKEGVVGGYSPHLMEEDRLTVASMLQKYNYQTACMGKWHLGMDWTKTGPGYSDIDFTQPIENGPTAFGFDYYYGISASLDMPPYVYIENDRVTQVPDRITSQSEEESTYGWWREGHTAPDFKHDEVLPHITTKVLDYIDRVSEDNPFFVYFPLTSPHTPILPSSDFQGKSGTNAYGDFVLMTDDIVGQVLQKLDDKGISENTIVIFTSDNGCAPHVNYQELARYGHNPSYVFRGHKADIYEGGHRIPLLIRWPEEITPNTQTDEPVCLADFMATVAEVIGYSLQENEGVDSRSHLLFWKGKQRGPLHEAIVHHSINGSFSIRQGRWKLELCPGSGGWSYPRPGEESEMDPEFQLYDLETDIQEKRNIVREHPDKVEELVSLLTKFITEGRSTPGAPQKNTEADPWPGLHWLTSS